MKFVILLISFNLAISAEIVLAQNIVNDVRHKFQTTMPCDPQVIKQAIQDRMLHLYNCYEENSPKVTHYVHAISKVDGKPIRYRKDDIDKAIYYDIIGFLSPFGGNQHNMSLRSSKKMGGPPAIEFYANNLDDGMFAEGVSTFIKGKHFRIGVLYDELSRDQAKNDLSLMLDNFVIR